METKKLVFFLTLGLIVVVLAFFVLSFGSMTGNVVANNDVKGGTLEIKGSDTLLQMVSNFAEEFSSQNPEVKISVTGGGSGTGIAALLNGEIDIADASRRIKDSEVKQANEAGFNPYEFIVARDMLSVIVHKENPIRDLSVEQIGAIYRGEITNWNEVGGEDKKITLYGRQSTSGTYAFFMEEVVLGDYSPHMRNLEGNQAILDAVRQDKTSIGYVGIGYIKDSSGNQVPGIGVLSVSNGGKAYSPLDESSIASYPISRGLYQYFAKKPEKGTVAYDFLQFELSDAGQRIVEKSGFVELSVQDRSQNDAMFRRL